MVPQRSPSNPTPVGEQPRAAYLTVGRPGEGKLEGETRRSLVSGSSGGVVVQRRAGEQPPPSCLTLVSYPNSSQVRIHSTHSRSIERPPAVRPPPATAAAVPPSQPRRLLLSQPTRPPLRERLPRADPPLADPRRDERACNRMQRTRAQPRRKAARHAWTHANGCAPVLERPCTPSAMYAPPGPGPRPPPGGSARASAGAECEQPTLHMPRWSPSVPLAILLQSASSREPPT